MSDDISITFAHLLTSNSSPGQFSALLLSAITEGWREPGGFMMTPDIKLLNKLLGSEGLSFDMIKQCEWDCSREPDKNDVKVFDAVFDDMRGLNARKESQVVHEDIASYKVKPFAYQLGEMLKRRDVIEAIKNDDALRRKFATLLLYFYPAEYYRYCIKKDNILGVHFIENVDPSIHYEFVVAMDRINPKSKKRTETLVDTIVGTYLFHLKKIFGNNIKLTFFMPKENQRTGTMKNLIMQMAETDFLFITDEDDIMSTYTEFGKVVKDTINSEKFDPNVTAFIHIGDRDHGKGIAPDPVWQRVLYMPNVRKIGYNQGIGLVDGEDIAPSIAFAMGRYYDKDSTIPSGAIINAEKDSNLAMYKWRGGSTGSRKRDKWCNDAHVTKIGKIMHEVFNGWSNEEATEQMNKVTIEDGDKEFPHRIDMPVILYKVGNGDGDFESMVNNIVFRPSKVPFKYADCLFETCRENRKIKVEKTDDGFKIRRTGNKWSRIDDAIKASRGYLEKYHDELNKIKNDLPNAEKEVCDEELRRAESAIDGFTEMTVKINDVKVMDVDEFQKYLLGKPLDTLAGGGLRKVLFILIALAVIVVVMVGIVLLVKNKDSFTVNEGQ